MPFDLTVAGCAHPGGAAHLMPPPAREPNRKEGCATSSTPSMATGMPSSVPREERSPRMNGLHGGKAGHGAGPSRWLAGPIPQTPA